MRNLFAFLFLALVSVACEPPRVVHHAAPLPPEVQKAQDNYWNTLYQVYQAQHDLDIARINEKEADLLAQRNTNQAAYTPQYMQLNAQLEEQRSKVEMRYNLAQQWYSDVQSGDLEAAKSVQQEMNGP